MTAPVDGFGSVGPVDPERGPLTDGGRLAEIRERVEAATNGPWEFTPLVHGDPLVAVADRGQFAAVAMCSTSPDDYGRANAEFIAAREDVPWLLDQLDAAYRTIRALTSSGAWFGAWECGCSTMERKPDGIPEWCPTHGERLVSDKHGRTKLEMTHSGVSGYGMRDANGDRVAAGGVS